MVPTTKNPTQFWMDQVSTWLNTIPVGPPATGPWVILIRTSLQGLIGLLTPYLP
jgi:hypothetical protein